jgi:hypothetical protein
VFQFVNVPMGVWIDEHGRVARPAEPAWTSSRTNVYGGKPLAIEGAIYVAALRDWVANGDSSRYVLSDGDFARRVKMRSPAEREADAQLQAGRLVPAGGQRTARREVLRARAGTES